MNCITFKTPEDIAHLIAEFKYHDGMHLQKGLLASGIRWSLIFPNHFQHWVWKILYTIMPFGITVAADVFQQKLDQCFSHLKNVIIIADDIMVVGKIKKSTV